MIYTIIISFLIEKPFVETTKLFISNSVRVYTFVKLYVPGMGLLILCFVPREGFLYTVIVLGGRVFALFELYPGGLSRGGWFWMKLIAA